MPIIEDGFWIDKKGEKVHPDLIKADDKLKDDVVEKLCQKAKGVSQHIFDFKQLAFSEVEEFYNLLLEKYKVDIKKNSKKGNLTLENYSGTFKVIIAVADRIAFDEKLTIAKTKIDEYLHEVTENASADIQTLITKAFEVDKKGDISPKKIMALKAYDIKHKKWLEAMGIIDEATEIVSSKNYIRFYSRKRIEDAYVQIQLDIAGV